MPVAYRLCCLLSLVLLVATAEAQGDACAFERYVVLASIPGFASELESEVRKDLAAELGPRGYGVCAERSSLAPSAEIRLSQPDAATVSIDVDDYTTGKRVGRDVTLARIPAGGRALAIAIAADELLRASWAELTLRKEREAQSEDSSFERREPTPDPLRRPVSARSSWRYTRIDPQLGFALLLGYAHGSSRFDAGQLELRAQVRPFGWGWLALGLGGVLARKVETPFGDAVARGMLGTLTLGACSRARGKLTGCAGARGTGYLLQLRGLHARGADALHDQAGALVVSAVGELRVKLNERFALLAELGLGGAAAAASATDGARVLMGVEGFVLSSALGLGVSL